MQITVERPFIMVLNGEMDEWSSNARWHKKIKKYMRRFFLLHTMYCMVQFENHSVTWWIKNKTGQEQNEKNHGVNSIKTKYKKLIQSVKRN